MGEGSTCWFLYKDLVVLLEADAKAVKAGVAATSAGRSDGWPAEMLSIGRAYLHFLPGNGGSAPPPDCNKSIFSQPAPSRENPSTMTIGKLASDKLCAAGEAVKTGVSMLTPFGPVYEYVCCHQGGVVWAGDVLRLEFRL